MAPSVLLDNADDTHPDAKPSVSDLQKYGNPSLKVTADHRIKMEEVPIPEPGPGEVLIHIQATGVCGSDIHFWKRGRIGTLTIDGDCVLGHEAAGTVVRAHPTVTTLRPGDRINLKFINRYRDTWPAGISALSGGVIDVKPLISHVFTLEQAKEALELCSDLSHGSIKVQVVDDTEVSLPTHA
ncbi:hypothetical protein SLS55_006398 [Diplodia seriata]|uniref:Alcohol dehydrogenase-like N-terminal domain-containing protein n=1 Tax=Diplodia seriata TaxID=420778 RepID=A0ABR3CHI4_9PEZI